MLPNLKSKLFISTAISGVVLATITTGQAYAQQSAADPVVEEVVVTGSRIKTTDTGTPAPVTVINAQTMEDRGFVQAGQMLNEMTAMRPDFVQMTTTSTALGSGQQSPNLFNLGSGRTLSLVNGRRTITTSSGLGDASTDTNIIPVGLLQRVDIIQGGGAAVYGSGAMAGVVNYVLKQDYQGAEVDVQGSVTGRGDYPNYNIRGTAGTNFADGKGNVAVNFEWSKNDSLLNTARPYVGALQIANPANTSPPAAAEPNGIPATIWSDNTTTLFDRTPNGVIFNNQLNSNLASMLTINGSQVQFTPTGGISAFNAGLPVSAGVAIGGDGNRVTTNSALYGGVERAVINALGHYDITDHIKLSAELLHAQTEGIDPVNRRYMVNFRNSGTALQANQAVAFNRTNPFLTPATRAALDLASPAFATGQNLYVGTIAETLLPSLAVITKSKSDRGLIGLDGDFDLGGRNYYWSASYSHAEASQTFDAWGYNRQRLINANNAVTNTAGQIVCGINADAITTNDDPNCYPINYFGAGNIDPRARNYVAVQSGVNVFGGTIIPFVNKQDDFLATLGGDVVSLPAGMSKFSVSYEHRVEKAVTTPSPADAQGLVYNGIPIIGTSSGYNTNEYAGELLIPVLGKGYELPFAKMVEFNLSGRLVDNSFNGLETVYAVGGRWETIEGFTLRGSYSRNFRTPNLTQLFAPTTVSTGTAVNPCSRLSIASGPAPAVRAANCLALFTANPNYGRDQAIAAGVLPANITAANRLANFQDNANLLPTVTITGGGNSALLNEVSTTQSFGIVMQPEFIPGLTIAADRIVLDLTNALQQFSAANFASTCFDGTPQPASFCSTIGYNADGTFATGRSIPTNAGFVKYRGEIYNVNYQFALGDLFSGAEGKVELGLEVTHNTGSYSFSGLTTTQTNGTTAVPPYTGKFDAHYTTGAWRINYSAFYLPEAPFNLTDNVENAPVVPVHGNLRQNISADYKFGDHYSFRFGVNNFTDKLASYPFTNGGYGDIIGRQFFAGVKVKF